MERQTGKVKLRARVSVSLHDEITRARMAFNKSRNGVKPVSTDTFLVYLLQTGLYTHQLGARMERRFGDGADG